MVIARALRSLRPLDETLLHILPILINLELQVIDLTGWLAGWLAGLVSIKRRKEKGGESRRKGARCMVVKKQKQMR